MEKAVRRLLQCRGRTPGQGPWEARREVGRSERLIRILIATID